MQSGAATRRGAMFVEKIKTEGLAQLSYLVGAGGQAAVIDPRRDCAIYIEMATEKSCCISHILETHRNEDLVSGAPAIAALTGDPVLNGTTDRKRTRMNTSH